MVHTGQSHLEMDDLGVPLLQETIKIRTPSMGEEGLRNLLARRWLGANSMAQKQLVKFGVVAVHKIVHGRTHGTQSLKKTSVELEWGEKCQLHVVS